MLGVVGSHQPSCHPVATPQHLGCRQRLDAEVCPKRWPDWVRQHMCCRLIRSPAWAVALPRRSWPRCHLPPRDTSLLGHLQPQCRQVQAKPGQEGQRLPSAFGGSARAAARTKTYLGAQYHRDRRQQGRHGRCPLHCCHDSIIKNKVPFVDDMRGAGRAVRQLERLGHKVILQAARM